MDPQHLRAPPVDATPMREPPVTLDLRTRMFARLLPLLPGGTVAGASPQRIRAIQERGIPDTPLTRVVLGKPAPGVTTTSDVMPQMGGHLRLLVHRPDHIAADTGQLPVIIHLHGGGWVRRDLGATTWLCTRVARGVPAVVVSVDYRLAPQHPFPAAVDDVIAATTWIAANAGRWGADGARMALLGDSAGANLAAVAGAACRDAGGPSLRSQVLLYPPVDLTPAATGNDAASSALVLTPQARDVFVRLYLGDTDRTNPRVSPLFADLHGLPPTLIQVGDHDPLRTQAARYADALRAAEVPVRATLYLGAVHGFLSFPGIVRSAHQAAWEIVHELRHRLHDAGHTCD